MKRESPELAIKGQADEGRPAQRAALGTAERDAWCWLGGGSVVPSPLLLPGDPCRWPSIFRLVSSADGGDDIPSLIMLLGRELLL